VRALAVTTTLAFSVLALAAGNATAAAAPVFRASLKVSTTRPKVEAPMRYTVRVTDAARKPIAARLTMQIRDPFGGVHPVEFDSRKVFIKNHRFVGTFVDQVEWPQSAVGFGLKFQAVVRAMGVTRILSVTVTTVP
jgi:hypothetical protein